MEFADDAVTALGTCLRAVAVGEIMPSEAAALATLIDVQRRVIDQAEIERRLAAIEARLKLNRVLGRTPPWLLWFTHGDGAGIVLGLEVPAFSIDAATRVQDQSHRHLP